MYKKKKGGAMGTVLVVPKMDIPSIKKATRTVPPVLYI
jgi:hypothetical protein